MDRVGYSVMLLFCNMLVSICAETDWEVAMVTDVVHVMERPSAVIATVCWPAHKKVQLHSALTSGRDELHVTMQQFVKMEDFPIRHEQDQHVIFVADLGCDNITEYLTTCSAKKYFRTPFRWILIARFNNESSEKLIPISLEDLEVFPDSEVIIARPETDGSYYLYYLYKISAKNTWRTEFYGSWNVNNKLIKNNQLESTALRRLNLHGHVISVCYVLTNSDSIHHLTDGINDHIDTITKVSYPTINHLFDLLNASRKFVFVDSWGYKINGSWTGLTGYLVRNEAEIGGSPMFFTSERIPVVSYISTPTPTQIRFVFRQPKLSYTNNLYVLSFNTTVWYSLVALVLLMFLALFAVATWEWKKNQDDVDMLTNARILRSDVKDVSLVILGAACQQGSPVELKGSPGRAVMFVLFLTLMFLYTAYSANIVALLQSSSSQIRTLEDLLHSRIKLGCHDTVYNRYYFSTATEPIRKAIYRTKVAPPGSKPRFISMEEGVRNIQKGLFGFHVEVGVAYKFVSKYFRESEKCGLTEIEYLQMLDPYQAVQRDTPYKEMFKIGFKRIKEHGLQTRENQKLYEKRPKCSGRESHFISVSMVDCYPAMLVLAYGMSLSVMLLFIEIIFEKRQRIAHRLCCKVR